MEGSKVLKRVLTDDSDVQTFEPVLIRLDKTGSAPDDIRIDKNEFKIGRARDNDEIILDTMVSRRHCIFRCEGNGEWTIKDLSSSVTFVNEVALSSGISRRIFDGDIVQFSTCNEFRYVFTLDTERVLKKPKMDKQIFDNVLIEQKTFAHDQECQRNVLKNQIETKQREQDELKFRLELLLRQRDTVTEDKEDFKKQITTLEGKIETGNQQEQHLQTMYSDLLGKLENERIQFEARLNKEKQKWQAALSMSKQEKDMLEVKMKEQMEKWREEQQTEWKNLMDNRVKQEKNIQAQLLNEKTVLEKKLKETEKALKQQEAKEDTSQIQTSSSITEGMDSCIFVETLNKNDPSKYNVLDTIDLTVATQPNVDTQSKAGLITKVSDIMDEQLTCSICSELFVKATTLNCTHTFCQYCINCWNKRRKECPVCRSPVSSMNRSIVLDNFIESMLDNLPMHLKDRRKEIIQERKALEKKKKIH